MAETLPGNDGSSVEQIVTLVGLWLGALLYGMYAVMFGAAMAISVKKNRGGLRFSKVLFYSMISMFIMISIWTGISLYRGTQAYALIAKPPMAVNYYHDVTQWDNFSFGLFVILLTWHADALMIYRCFITWGRSFWVILLPTVLLALNFSISSAFLVWNKNNDALPFRVAITILDIIYPLNVTQSILTTGIISWRIIAQHRASVAAGVHRISRGGVHLLTIVRIIIESAMIFTIQQLILLILLRLKSPVQMVFHVTTIPSIGIVFVLMALRTHFAQTSLELSQVSSGGVRYATSQGTASSRPGHGSLAVFTTSRTVTVREPDGIHLGIKPGSRKRGGGDISEFSESGEVVLEVSKREIV